MGSLILNLPIREKKLREGWWIWNPYTKGKISRVSFRSVGAGLRGQLMRLYSQAVMRFIGLSSFLANLAIDSVTICTTLSS
mgnify:CR=1 FL=1